MLQCDCASWWVMLKNCALQFVVLQNRLNRFLNIFISSSIVTSLTSLHHGFCIISCLAARSRAHDVSLDFQSCVIVLFGEVVVHPICCCMSVWNMIQFALIIFVASFVVYCVAIWDYQSFVFQSLMSLGHGVFLVTCGLISRIFSWSDSKVTATCCILNNNVTSKNKKSNN